MDKNEFLDILRSQLSGQMPEGQINTHIQYYRNYIEERMQSGNSESEVMRELGDPRLIARTLLDTETGLFDLVWQVARDPDRCDRSGHPVCITWNPYSDHGDRRNHYLSGAFSPQTITYKFTDRQ